MREFINKNINVFVFLGLLFFGIIIYFVINEENSNKYHVEYVDDINELDNEDNDMKMMLINKDGLLEVLSFNSIEIDNDNIYEKIFALYNEYQNSLPIDYSSPFKEAILEREITVIGNKLIITMDSLSSNNDIEKINKCLMWTYQILGIEEIELNVGKTSLTLEKDIDVNKVILSTLGKKQTILFSTDKGFIPYTFYHEENNLDFLLRNILGDKYNYTYLNNVLSIEIEEEVEDSVIEYIDENLEYININEFEIIKK